MKEKLSARDERKKLAFEHYIALGENRSYTSVAEVMNLSKKVIEVYAREDRWQEKLSELYLEKSESIKQKREQLEELGFEVSLSALKKIKEIIDNGGISKELGQTFEIFLKCPYSTNNISPVGVEDKSACATSSTTDTPETQSVIEQIDKSLNALSGDDNG